MTQLTVIMLIIISIMLIIDLLYLKKILKILRLRKESSLDEKYFELKYHINLLKSVSAISLFVLGFLGYSNYYEFKTNMKEDLSKAIKSQRDGLVSINSNIENYKLKLDTLGILNDDLHNLSNSNVSDLKHIDRKITDINKSFKYNPKVYIVNDLVYSSSSNDTVKFKFANMTTIHGEELPKFTKVPFVIVQGYRIGIDILQVTQNYILVDAAVFYDDGNGKYPEKFKFDLWIGSKE